VAKLLLNLSVSGSHARGRMICTAHQIFFRW